MINTVQGKRTIGECVLLFFSLEGVSESWEERVLNGPRFIFVGIKPVLVLQVQSTRSMKGPHR